VELDDRLSIATPEGVDLELALAGLGSRFVAAILDALVQAGLIAAAALLLFVPDFGGVGYAVFVVVLFLVFFAYDILFEVLASGRTLGKRWTGLRVVRVGGAPVGFLTSTARNVMRLVDMIPGVYGVGALSILVTRKNQRLGDVVAGTLVVRERRAYSAAAPYEPRGLDAFSRLDVTAITAEELAAVRSFLTRRHDLEPAPRGALARALAEKLRPKVGGATEELRGDEAFLEQLAASKAARL
jgi:uncharacterized RDD family membrane protein YckC